MITALATHLWASTLFLALLLAVVAVARKRLTATARFWLALIGMVKFAIPGSILKPLMTAAPRPLTIPLPVLLGGGLTSSAPPQAPSIWPWIAAGIWAGVALALILRFALTRHRLVAFAVRTALPAERREIEALSRARHFLGIRRSIDIARSSLQEAPAVLRIFRPLIVLPTHGCDDLSDGELESLLRHECAHVARHDNLIARIESLICALFWFHPLIWIAQRITAIERERACDELVAGSADERDTYLAALTKFCHAAIAPRLPGVSCMATANLKERIDHVMNYETLKQHAPSPRRVAFIAAAALVLFTVASAMIGSISKDDQPYTITVEAKRSGDIVTLWGTVRDNKSGTVVSSPAVKFEKGTRAMATSKDSPLEVTFDIHPDSGDRIAVDVTIRRDGQIVETAAIGVKPTEVAGGGKYTGDPISLSLKDADLRDVIGMFGKLTGLDMKIDDDVQGKVTVHWQNVPWDKALDTLLAQNGCTYRLEGKTIHVTKQ
jgi:beta-lactamase regulating signal transducer with metallopeptidase domain